MNMSGDAAWRVLADSARSDLVALRGLSGEELVLRMWAHAGRMRRLRRGVFLEAVTVGYNALEGIIAVAAGLAAGSVALNCGLDRGSRWRGLHGLSVWSHETTLIL